MNTRLLVLLLALAPVSLAAQSGAEHPTTPPPSTAPAAEPASGEAAQKLAAKQEELASIAQEISDLQERAEANETVKAAKTTFREAMRAEMIRAAPQMQADINRQIALVDELTQKVSPTNKDAADHAGKLAEYRTLHDKLADVERDAQNVPEVQNARKAYYDSLVAEMQRLDPKTQELLAKHRELNAIVRELAAQAGGAS